MFRKHPEHLVVHFGCNFEPQVGFARHLSEAAEFVQGRVKVKHWSFATERYFLRDLEHRYAIALEYNRFGFVGIGLEAWEMRRNEFGELFRLSFEKMGIERLSRIGLRVALYSPTGMTHAELAELMFGSFFVDSKELEPICGSPDDALAQLHGQVKGMKTQTIIAPMNSKQASANFASQSGLELLVETKNYDTVLKEARDKIAHDCLLVDSDLSLEDVPLEGIHLFVRDSLDVADLIAENCISRLKGLQANRGNQDGASK